MVFPESQWFCGARDFDARAKNQSSGWSYRELPKERRAAWLVYGRFTIDKCQGPVYEGCARVRSTDVGRAQCARSARDQRTLGPGTGALGCPGTVFQGC
jgi:hypothetical protein